MRKEWKEIKMEIAEWRQQIGKKNDSIIDTIN